MEQQFICNACGQIGKPNEKLRGNTAVEFILWWFFIIPGVVYSFWRRSNKDKVCASCGNATLIPADSPMGRKLLSETAQTLPEVKKEKKEDRSKKLLIIFFVLFVFFLIMMLSVASQK